MLYLILVNFFPIFGKYFLQKLQILNLKSTLHIQDHFSIFVFHLKNLWLLNFYAKKLANLSRLNFDLFHSNVISTDLQFIFKEFHFYRFLFLKINHFGYEIISFFFEFFYCLIKIEILKKEKSWGCIEWKKLPKES